ncbi:TPM domain-containing protein [Sphaerobacter sp.]|uniref:DUF2207 family protein n=1 Tax=Sphaerobacter sp. TaxID=2099654 RepID=UPI001DDEB6A9|nr:TPM domain-containing protein [Sphaerobacter sp.]MBX5446378.1 DUF2207 domain-containing protein [Sphaerobacter sp.]
MLAFVRSSWSSWRLILAAGFVVALLLPTGTARAAEYGEPVPGQHIYDTTGLLTPDEIADLEARAAAVEAAGAPIVVYLQARDASQSETEAEARALMDAWDVQSAPGAHDGVVMFFNLRPGNLRRGQVFIYAGEKHYDGGNLPESELQRIIDEEMIPLLRDNQTAEGIGAGLDAIAHSLTNGPPKQPVHKWLARLVTAGRFSIANIVSAAVGMFMFLVGLATYQARSISRSPVVPTTKKPDDTPPAIAGALVSGRVIHHQLEATLIDLAQRGALAIEPAGGGTVQLRLVDRSRIKAPFELALWTSLELASRGTGVVPGEVLGELWRFWGRARAEVRSQLEASGLFDREGISRRPVRLAMVVAVPVFLAVIAAESVAHGSSMSFGAVLIALGVLGAMLLSARVPETTPLGQSMAVPWRGYKEGIVAAAYNRSAELDLDEALPYAVAFGVVDKLDKHIREASAAGWQPLWFNMTRRSSSSSGDDFYYYWQDFHRSTRRSSSSSSSSSDSASSGGGGAGGRF